MQNVFFLPPINYQGRPFSLPSQRNFPISFKPNVAIAEFFWKMQKKKLVFHFEGGRHAALPQKPVVKTKIFFIGQ